MEIKYDVKKEEIEAPIVVKKPLSQVIAERLLAVGIDVGVLTKGDKVTIITKEELPSQTKAIIDGIVNQ